MFARTNPPFLKEVAEGRRISCLIKQQPLSNPPSPLFEKGGGPVLDQSIPALIQLLNNPLTLYS